MSAHRPSYRLQRVTFFGPAESSQPYPLRQKSPRLSLAFVGGFFSQCLWVFLIIMESFGFISFFSFPLFSPTFGDNIAPASSDPDSTHHPHLQFIWDFRVSFHVPGTGWTYVHIKDAAWHFGGGMNSGQSQFLTWGCHASSRWDAFGLETYLSARFSSHGFILYFMLSAWCWEEFSLICSKIIPKSRNHEPINPEKLHWPRFLKSALSTCPL